jgi:hypothetical protein
MDVYRKTRSTLLLALAVAVIAAALNAFNYLGEK